MLDRRNFIQLAGAQTLLATLPVPTLAAEHALPTRPIPGTDEPLAVVGLGNSRAFIDGDVATSSQLLDIFLDHGGMYVDVSGQSRVTVGSIVRESNAQQKTFLGNYLTGDDLAGLRQEIGRLQNVQGAGPIDLAMKRDVNDLAARADEFRALKEEGLVRYVGIGRPSKQFYPGIMDLIEKGAVDFIQVNYSMMEPEAAERILPMARDHGIAVVINRPFINGDYFSLIRGHELPEWAAEFDCNSWAQFSLKYILAHPAVNCVLTETANPKHALDNLGAGFGRLPGEQMRERMRQHLLGLA